MKHECHCEHPHEGEECDCPTCAAEAVSAPDKARGALLRTFLRFSGIWLVVALLFGSTSAVCPFCGQAGCPVGAGSAGLLGGIAAFVLQGRKLIGGFFGRIFRRRGRD